MSSGVAVSLHSADMSVSTDVYAAMHGAHASAYAGSKGPAGFDLVLHAAGVLQDSLIGNQSQSSIRAVMAPKAAINILAATAAMPLQQLVLFSSVATCVGAAGQANYVAANAVLDGWALAGRRQGVAVSSIQWGAWATAGEASVLPRQGRLVQQTVLHVRFCVCERVCVREYALRRQVPHCVTHAGSNVFLESALQEWPQLP